MYNLPSQTQPVVHVQLLASGAKLPVKPKSADDAGFDVFTLDHGVIVPPMGNVLLSTGLRVDIPAGYCIQVNPRSGKASNHGLVVGARIIDSPYRGELKINLINLGKDPYEVSCHDPVAQLVILPCAGVMVQVDEISPVTERGSGGFGSTDRVLTEMSKDQAAKPVAKNDVSKLNDLMEDVLSRFLSTEWDEDPIVIINSVAGAIARGPKSSGFFEIVMTGLAKLRLLNVSPEVLRSHILNHLLTEFLDPREVESWAEDDLVPSDLAETILKPLLNRFK